jgi:predicted AAA+ superfamily ATPase
VILLVSDLLDPAEEVQAQLKQLHFLGHEVLVFQVLDRDELDFPFDKDRIFEDMESGERRRVRPQQVRQTYLERFEAFQENYRRLFRALEIHHLVLPTDADPGRALAFFLAQRQAFA